jgi:hypothetical protein
VTERTPEDRIAGLIEQIKRDTATLKDLAYCSTPAHRAFYEARIAEARSDIARLEGGKQ